MSVYLTSVLTAIVQRRAGSRVSSRQRHCQREQQQNRRHDTSRVTAGIRRPRRTGWERPPRTDQRTRLTTGRPQTGDIAPSPPQRATLPPAPARLDYSTLGTMNVTSIMGFDFVHSQWKLLTGYRSSSGPDQDIFKRGHRGLGRPVLEFTGTAQRPY